MSSVQNSSRAYSARRSAFSRHAEAEDEQNEADHFFREVRHAARTMLEQHDSDSESDHDNDVMHGAKGALPRDEQVWYSKFRLLQILLVAAIQFATLRIITGDGAAHAAPIDNMRDEFFPDLNKYHEKMDNGLEMLLHQQEYAHAQQVVKFTSWMQQFCAANFFMEGHMAPVWQCVMSNVRINDGLGSEPDRKATLLEPGFELMNCSKPYMHVHMARGDNGNKNPWGQLPRDILAHREENPDSVAKLEGYDEWPFMERSPFYKSIHNARDCDDIDAKRLGWKGSEVEAFKKKIGLGDSTFKALRSMRLGGESMDPAVLHHSLGLPMNVATTVSRDLGGVSGPLVVAPNATFATEAEQAVVRKYRPLASPSQILASPDESPGGVTSDDLEQKAEAVINSRNRNRTDCKDREYNSATIEGACLENAGGGSDMTSSEEGYYSECRNHHWGPLIYICRPESLKIQYYTENGAFACSRKDDIDCFDANGDTGEHTRSWYMFDFNYWNIEDTGWYQTSVTVKTGVHMIQTKAWHLVFFLPHLLFYVVTMAPATVTIIMWPVTLIRLIVLRFMDDKSFVADRCADMVDYRRSRTRYLTIMQCMLENAATLCFYISIVVSIYSAVIPSMPQFTDPKKFGGFSNFHLAPYDDKETLMFSHDLDEMEETHRKCMTEDADCEVLLLSPYAYVRLDIRHRELSLLRLFAVYIRIFCFAGHAKMWLAWNMVFLIVRCGALFSVFKALRWLPDTVMLCIWPVVTMLFMFFIVILGFAVMFNAAFGSTILCFHSVQRAMSVLILYIFGLYDPMGTHIHTFQETTGGAATAALAMYNLFVIIISLNFFTSIVMVGYSTATESSRAQRQAKLLAQTTEAWTSIFSAFHCSGDEIIDQKLRLNLVMSNAEDVRYAKIVREGREAGKRDATAFPEEGDEPTRTTEVDLDPDS
jgi:hypothetical protein